MPRYNVGDVVYVKPFDKIAENFVEGLGRESGITPDNRLRFVGSMKQYCDGLYVVKRAYTRMGAENPRDERNDRYQLTGCDDWMFSNSMLSDHSGSYEVNVSYTFDELFADSEGSRG